MCLAYHLRKTLSMYRKMPKENLTFIHETISIKFVKNKFNKLNDINDEVKSMTKSFDEQAKQQIDAAKHEIISSIAETMDLYGVTPSAGTLYATLYLNDEMNLDEMRTELNMSKPSMSTGIRKLHNNGMVKKVHQTETRKHVYTAEKDFFKSALIMPSSLIPGVSITTPKFGNIMSSRLVVVCLPLSSFLISFVSNKF